MALQSIKGGLPIPLWPPQYTTAPNNASSTYTINAAGEKVALVCRATATKSIRKIVFRTATVTVGDTLDCRIETVDGTTGDPSGTLFGTNTNVSLVVNSTDDNLWLTTAALTADASVNKGDLFAIVLVNGGGGGNMQIQGYGDDVQASGFPYGDLFDTGAWAKSAAATPVMGVEYSDGSYEAILGLHGAGVVNNNTFNSGSSPSRRGNLFTLPFPARAAGCWAWVDADGDFTIRLYDSDGTTVLATTGSIDKDVRQNTAAGMFFLPFTATANLSKNTNYRISIEPDTVTSLISYDFDVPTAGYMDQFCGGQSVYSTTYTSPNWTETTTKRAFVGVFLDAFDDGTAVGGGTNVFIMTE